MKWVYFLSLCLVFGSFVPHRALAEGNCPSGYYPIGGQGVRGCAPIPGRSQQQDATSGPSNRIYYDSRWGAAAYSQSLNAAAVAEGELTKEEAERKALTKCAREGRDCKIVMTYSNQCFAWVLPVDGGAEAHGGLGVGTTTSLALEQAQSNCVDPNGKGCYEFYTGCSPPVRSR